MKTTQQELKAFYDLLDSPDDQNKKLALGLYKTVNLKPHQVIKYILLSGKGWADVTPSWCTTYKRYFKSFLGLTFCITVYVRDEINSKLQIEFDIFKKIKIYIGYNSANTYRNLNAFDSLFFDLKNSINNETTKN